MMTPVLLEEVLEGDQKPLHLIVFDRRRALVTTFTVTKARENQHVENREGPAHAPTEVEN